jgi:hypothetical protein
VLSHYKVEGPFGIGDLDGLFPQFPPSVNASVEALLENRYADGWQLFYAGEDHNGNWRFLFVANAKNT